MVSIGVRYLNTVAELSLGADEEMEIIAHPRERGRLRPLAGKGPGTARVSDAGVPVPMCN